MKWGRIAAAALVGAGMVGAFLCGKGQSVVPESLTATEESAEEPLLTEVVCPVPVRFVRERATPEPSIVETFIEKVPAEKMPCRTPASPEALSLRNETGYVVDLGSLTTEKTDLSPEEMTILILHTHGTESYTPEPGEDYEAVSSYRTCDEEESVIAVGETIGAVLREQGFSVIHDKTLCDYPEYTGAYNRSRAVAQSNIEAHPEIFLVLDVHRDSIENSDGGVQKLTAQVGEEAAAQVMLVVGTDDGGLEHPNWRGNLAFATKIACLMEGECPGILRPINLRQERFNQDLGQYAMLVEVGTSGNTLEEAERGAGIFAEALGEALKETGCNYP